MVAGAVLAVRVHQDDALAGHVLPDKTQSDRDGSLVPEVATEMKDVDPVNDFEVVAGKARRWLLGRAVVDQNHSRSGNLPAEGRIQRGQKQLAGVPVVIKRDQENEIAAVFGSIQRIHHGGDLGDEKGATVHAAVRFSSVVASEDPASGCRDAGVMMTKNSATIAETPTATATRLAKLENGLCSLPRPNPGGSGITCGSSE